MTSPLGPSFNVTVPIAAPTPVAVISLIVTTTCSARTPSAAASKMTPTEKRHENIDASQGFSSADRRPIRFRAGSGSYAALVVVGLPTNVQCAAIVVGYS